MNNNYHTQLDKQNNMLHEIAVNNQLIPPTQVPSYSGTSINQSKDTTNLMPQLTPQQYQQLLVQQQQFLQQVQKQQPSQNSMESTVKVTKNEMDEIELSETKPDQTKFENKSKQPKQIEQFTNGDSRMKQEQLRQLHQEQIRQMQMQNQMMRSQNQTRPPDNKLTSSNKNGMIEYGILPAIILVSFIVLVHPSTSKILGKWLPPMTNMKGYFIRGLILAIMYIIARMIANRKSKK